MRRIKNIQEHRADAQRVKNEPTRAFEKILANRDKRDHNIELNRKNYGHKE